MTPEELAQTLPCISRCYPAVRPAGTHSDACTSYRKAAAYHLAEPLRKVKETAWDEGLNAALQPVNTGTRMTLEAVIPVPDNPYTNHEEEGGAGANR